MEEGLQHIHIFFKSQFLHIIVEGLHFFGLLLSPVGLLSIRRRPEPLVPILNLLLFMGPLVHQLKLPSVDDALHSAVQLEDLILKIILNLFHSPTTTDGNVISFPRPLYLFLCLQGRLRPVAIFSYPVLAHLGIQNGR